MLLQSDYHRIQQENEAAENLEKMEAEAYKWKGIAINLMQERVNSQPYEHLRNTSKIYFKELYGIELK